MYGYEYLKNLVDDLGHKRSSGVDSELFVHILEELLKRFDRENAIKKFIKYTEGNIIVLFNDGVLYGIPARSFVLAKIGNGYIITSEIEPLKSILDANSMEEVKIYLPKEDKGLVKISIENDKPSALLWGEWSEDVLKYNSWIAHSHIMCDFCKQYKLCERITYKGKDFDRCLECYKNNRNPEETSKDKHDIVVVWDSDSRLKQKENVQKKDFVSGLCLKCFKQFTLDELVYCTKCKRHFCFGCLAGHEHNKKYSLNTTYGVLS